MTYRVQVPFAHYSTIAHNRLQWSLAEFVAELSLSVPGGVRLSTPSCQVTSLRIFEAARVVIPSRAAGSRTNQLGRSRR